MAQIRPFQPYRYTEKAGPIKELVTQPYDKITPGMQARYLARGPHNFVRVLLGERFPSDSETDNVYTRAARYLNDWIARGVLARDAEPAFYPYFQEFRVPDTGEKVARKGFIGLGPVEDYSAGVVYRHEQTLYGPKKDRLELLRHTRAHLGQIFMLYADREGAVDRLLEEAAQSPPLAAVTDEYEAVHRVWRIPDAARVAAITRLMAGKELLIADGHHRYETAQAFRDENPDVPEAGRVMMTFVNMHSPGVRILATHRLLGGLENLDAGDLIRKARERFRVEALESAAALKERWATPAPERIRIGLAFAGTGKIHLLETDRAEGELDVKLLHEFLLGRVLGIGEEAVREQKYLRYIRGLDAAVDEVRGGGAQIAFLLEPTTVDQVAEVSFSGRVMPQKSTDFYPKLLSGFTVYKLDAGR